MATQRREQRTMRCDIHFQEFCPICWPNGPPQARQPTAEHTDDAKLDKILNDVRLEVAFATDKFGPHHSAHEGFAILLEEVDELKAHVWTNQVKRDLSAMRDEAIQVAAMAVRFAHDVCDDTRGRV